jgi:DNA-binding NarL/FixJ family response regulator
VSSEDKIRILIVEDHQVVAEGLSALLNDQPDMVVVGSAGSVAESISRAEKVTPDVILADFRLTDGTGADAGLAIRRVIPDIKLIVLTREDTDAARFAALEAGASAFIPKSRAAAEVVDAIRKVAAGGTLFTPRTIAGLLNRRREMDSVLESLTAREKEVLRFMAEAASSREIAARLGISYATVRTHIRSVGSKLGVHSKLEAIVKARAMALID